MPPIDLDVSYVIDSFYLTALKRKMLLLMEPETVDLLGWIDKVHDDLVNISYQDEAGHLVYADVPRDWFHRFHDLGEGSQFVIQTWEEAGEPRCEFLPVADSDPARSRSAAARAIQRFEHSHKKLPMPDPDHPAKPKDWSNPDEVLRYYKALDERYKNIDWGRGTRP
ncbi:MAG: hypothetical protein NTU53_08590 [Planctomycetota bacterium]|nr:hypothetical protein [Planctomycetota bacterium]